MIASMPKVVASPEGVVFFDEPTLAVSADGCATATVPTNWNGRRGVSRLELFDDEWRITERVAVGHLSDQVLLDLVRAASVKGADDWRDVVPRVS